MRTGVVCAARRETASRGILETLGVRKPDVIVDPGDLATEVVDGDGVSVQQVRISWAAGRGAGGGGGNGFGLGEGRSGGARLVGDDHQRVAAGWHDPVGFEVGPDNLKTGGVGPAQ